MRRICGLLGVSCVALACVFAAPASRAGADISFGINAPIGDDGNLFFSISSRYFDREPAVVTDWARRFPNPDDLAVFLHVCHESRLAPEVIYRYRRTGLSWYDVGVRAGLPREVWYVPGDRDSGPPYGNAYGYHRNHDHDAEHARLNDRQVRDLVSVRMAREYYGVSPEVAMNWRKSGCDVRTMMTREYHSRHQDDRHDHGGDRGDHGDHGRADHGNDRHGKHHDDRHDH
jgi:hypothetical protein